MKKKIITLENVLMLLLFLYFVLKPFYILPSGLPQISDFICILIYVILFFTKTKKEANPSEKKILHDVNGIIPFILWVVFVNMIWSIYLIDFSLMRSIIYYLFNFLSMIVMYKLYVLYKEKILYKSVNFISYSVIFQFILSFVYRTNSYREALFFNNPNQLGLYGIICLTYCILLNKYQTKKIINVTALIASMYLIFISLSKAAIIGSIFMLFLYYTLINKSIKIKFIVAIVVLFVLLFNNADVIYDKVSSIPMLEKVLFKIENMKNENDSNLGSGRGYDRIKEIGFHVIYGVGEGKWDRFDSIKGVEIHSAYASILCYYGIIGSILLIYFIYKIFKTNIYDYMIFSGIFLYGMTHQIWRNTMIWILFVLLLIHRQKKGKNEKNI